ncbi:MAG: hypothetical protein IKV03_02925 [Alphaproteobacteria bacterium]|nr:hypothetical protein [Alphaproteobacteria bacterium]
MNVIKKYAKLITLEIVGILLTGAIAGIATELVCGAGIENALTGGLVAIATTQGIKKLIASNLAERLVKYLVPSQTMERTI